MDEEKINRKLETIVEGVNSKNKIKQVFYYGWGIYVGGVLPEKYQKEFAEKIGWTSRKLTTWNAILIGGGTTLEYLALIYLGKESKAFVPEQIANVFGIAYQTSLYSYMTFNACQNLFRVAYAQVKKKGIASFSLMGGIIDTMYFAWRFLRKDKPAGKKDLYEIPSCRLSHRVRKPAEGFEPPTY